MSRFRFTVEKAFPIPGRGVVVAGRVEEGTVAAGQEVGFLKADGQWGRGVVIGVEVSGRIVEETVAGQQANLLLEGIKRGQLTAGVVLVEPPISAESSRPQSEYFPEMPSPPSSPSYGGPIRPTSSFGRILIAALIGILILLAFWFLQEKEASPQKGTRLQSEVETSDLREV